MNDAAAGRPGRQPGCPSPSAAGWQGHSRDARYLRWRGGRARENFLQPDLKWLPGAGEGIFLPGTTATPPATRAGFRKGQSK